MPKKIPMRMCVGCKEMRPKRELLRVVRSQEGAIALDATGKASGRGAYICRKAECLEKAKKSRGLERAFERRVDEAVYEKLKGELDAIERRD